MTNNLHLFKNWVKVPVIYLDSSKLDSLSFPTEKAAIRKSGSQLF